MILPSLGKRNRVIEGSPKVSVLVPCYNVQKYVEQCLDSLLAQTLKDIQIICIDDGSTDATSGILDDYAKRDRRITVIHKANSGYGASMNCAIDIATGAYIGIVESDDFIEPDAFERLFSLAQEHSLDIAKAEFYNFYNNADVKENTFQTYTECGLRYGKVFDPAQVPSIIRSTPSIWAAIYRRRMIVDEGIRFTESPGASFQDTAFVMKCWFAARRAYVVPEAYLHYRNDNPNSSVKTTTKIHAVADEFASSNEFMKKDPERRAQFLDEFQVIAFDTYRWNYNRIASEAHAECAQRMQRDLSASFEAGDLKQSQFDEERWSFIEAIMNDPEAFAKNHEEGF